MGQSHPARGGYRWVDIAQLHSKHEELFRVRCRVGSGAWYITRARFTDMGHSSAWIEEDTGDRIEPTHFAVRQEEAFDHDGIPCPA